jgi:hypothetical protein
MGQNNFFLNDQIIDECSRIISEFGRILVFLEDYCFFHTSNMIRPNFSEFYQFF